MQLLQLFRALAIFGLVGWTITFFLTRHMQADTKIIPPGFLVRAGQMTALFWTIAATITLATIGYALYPYYVHSGDPDYFYLLGGFNLLHGLPLYAIDHPGIPLYLVSAVFLGLTGLSPLEVYGNTDGYLAFLLASFLVIRAFSCYYILRRTPLLLGLLITFYPCLMGSSAIYGFVYTPESLYYLYQPWLCYLVFASSTPRRDTALGLLLGLMVMTKLPGLLLVPCCLLLKPGSVRRILLAGLAMCLFLGLFLLPQLGMYLSYMSSWLFRKHGYVDIDFPHYLNSLGVSLSYLPLLVTLPLFLAFTWNKLHWRYYVYVGVIYLLTFRWGVARYTYLVMGLCPVLLYWGLQQIRDRKTLWLCTGLLFLLPLATLVERLLVDLTLPQFSQRHVESYGSRSKDYALYYGWSFSGRWLPYPQINSSTLMLHTTWDGVPQNVELPIVWLNRAKLITVSTNAELQSIPVKLYYLTCLPYYRNWFREQILAHNRTSHNQVNVPAYMDELAVTRKQ